MTDPAPSLEHLRAQARTQGVSVPDEDLERVRGFLAVLLPALAELERDIPADTVPAGLYDPEREP